LHQTLKERRGDNYCTPKRGAGPEVTQHPKDWEKAGSPEVRAGQKGSLVKPRLFPGAFPKTGYKKQGATDNAVTPLTP